MRRCHSRERDAQLAARQVRTEAAVHAAAERDVAVRARGRSARRRRRRTRPGRRWRRRSSTITAVPAAIFTRSGARCPAWRPAARRSAPATPSAAAPRPRAGMSVGIVDELPAMLGMRGEERVEARERVAHGVEPGDEEQEADVEDLFARELLAVDLDLRKCERMSSVGCSRACVDEVRRSTS